MDKYLQGRAEGKAEGKAEGRAEGRAEGMVELRVEIALSMLAAQEPIDKISQFTGLSAAEIAHLQASM
jgi:predicted transposase YdaD